MKVIYYLICISIILSISGNLNSQVTIGSNIDPNKGSLLDLKERNPSSGNTNATRGLLLPRIELKNKTNLYPMFETSPGSNTPTIDYQGENKDIQDAGHTGLMIYNLNRCNGFGKGTYYWNGTSWEPLADVKFLDNPQIFTTSQNTEWLDTNTLLIRLPSGKDLRPFNADQSLTLGWKPSNVAVNKTNVTDASFGGLKITSNPPGSWENPSTNPTTYSYSINDMSDIITSDNPRVSDPFRSRETIVNFSTDNNECGDNHAITVRLNQTSYRVTVKKSNPTLNETSYWFRTGGRFETGTYYYRFLLTPVNSQLSWGDSSDMELQSNAVWKSGYDATSYSPNVFSDINMPDIGGLEIIDGTTPEILWRRPIRNPDAENYGTRGELAGTLTFSDTAAVARFYPVMVDILQCSVNLYDETSMQNEGRNRGPWLAGSGVKKHTDQSGRFFYSAEFGAAGRWMTTNLAATEYDTESGLAGEPSAQPVPYDNSTIGDQENGKRKYAYPQTNLVSGTASDWGAQPANWKQTEGLFYNWYAATGRTFQDNGGNEEQNTTVAPKQGICPNGWHIPSDKEWNELEKEVYESIGKYSTYDQLLLDEFVPQMGSWNPSWDTATGERGAWLMDGNFGHSSAMREICGINGEEYYWLIATKNYSKLPRLGGFNAMMTGRIKAPPGEDGNINSIMQQVDRNGNGDYWTVSQGGDGGNTGWYRSFSIYGSVLSRDRISKVNLVSVRCKQNYAPIPTR